MRAISPAAAHIITLMHESPRLLFAMASTVDADTASPHAHAPFKFAQNATGHDERFLHSHHAISGKARFTARLHTGRRKNNASRRRNIFILLPILPEPTAKT